MDLQRQIIPGQNDIFLGFSRGGGGGGNLGCLPIFQAQGYI